MMQHQCELIVDSFAGGGGASTGIEMALGRSPDYAINHDAEALSLHAANHPSTVHLSENIYKVDPLDVVGGRPVGLLWASPDCRHFSKAKGGAPVQRNIRDLAWVVVSWARRAKPRVIILENVEEFLGWGPVVEDEAGRAFPCPERKGETFKKWIKALKAEGYKVEWRELRACDYGAPTIRKRLFIIARRDGAPIVWPKPTHAPASASKDGIVTAWAKGHGLTLADLQGLKPWSTAADIIDWSLPCPSIFATAAEIFAEHGLRAVRPLKPATMARIAKGVKRYVLDAAKPFIVPVTHGGDLRTNDIDEPLRTQTTANRGEHAVVVPHIMTMRNAQKPHNAADEPTHTVTAGGAGLSVVASFLAQHNTDMVGHDAREPVSTIVGKGCTQAIVSAGLLNMKGSDRRDGAIDAPVPTLCANGNHVAEVRAFLAKYYGADDQSQACDEPMHTLTTKPRHGLVVVRGVLHQIIDIGMRMLTPRERFNAQGFPPDYKIDHGHDGQKLTLEAQGRMCGNSVCPPLARALVSANCSDLAVARDVAA